MNNYFINGQATFAMNYFAFLPALVNQGTNPNYYDKIGFFSNPPGPYGQQFASLGGQGTSINTYIDDERKQASLEFIKWFASDAVQMKWAELGGYTCNKKALASDAFLNGSAVQRGRSPRRWAWSKTSTTSRNSASSCRPPRPPSATTSSRARARPRKRSTASPRSTQKILDGVRLPQVSRLLPATQRLAGETWLSGPAGGDRHDRRARRPRPDRRRPRTTA